MISVSVYKLQTRNVSVTVLKKVIEYANNKLERTVGKKETRLQTCFGTPWNVYKTLNLFHNRHREQ